MHFSQLLGKVLLVSTLAVALEPQTDTWNSTFSLSTADITAANISNATAQLINIAARFEQTNWATGSVLQDSFYTDIPSNASSSSCSSLPVGSLLKVQEYVNTSYYTLAPTLALSRFLFVSESLNGTRIPASAYVLWPLVPLQHGTSAGNGNASSSTTTTIPVVGWAHGLSGFLPECAPSHIRNLWYHFSVPYTLALSGYAVVAPDYAGLGVNRTADGQAVVNEPLSFPAGANDVIGAVQAAQTAFASLSQDFVVVGHSLGGGAAWAVAQKMASSLVPGYLGAVAGSPVANITHMRNLAGSSGSDFGIMEAAQGVVNAYGSDRVQLSDIQVQGCNSVVDSLLVGLATEGDPAKLIWSNQSFYSSDLYTEWVETTANGGGKPIGGGPLLIVQGTADTVVPEVITTDAVNQTCQAHPDSDIEYLRFEDMQHVPAMFASQRFWLQWVADRFAGKPVAKRGCQLDTIYGQTNAPRPLSDYQANSNFFLEYAKQVYQY